MSEGLDAKQLRDYVVRPTLQGLDLWSESAEFLVLVTAEQESRRRYLHQIKGPALGLWQIEPATHQDLWKNWLSYRPLIANKVLAVAHLRTRDASPYVVEDAPLIWNLAYAAAICRLIYRRSPMPLPSPADNNGLWTIYKLSYNSTLGAATQPQFLAAIARAQADLSMV